MTKIKKLKKMYKEAKENGISEESLKEAINDIANFKYDLIHVDNAAYNLVYVKEPELIGEENERATNI